MTILAIDWNSLNRGYIIGFHPLSQSGCALELTRFVFNDILFTDCIKVVTVSFDTVR
jgi:hypothetical protein